MPEKSAITLHCPICKKAVASNDSDSPFCSPRCRTIDLGKWASGDYVIPSPVTDIDEQFERAVGAGEDRNGEDSIRDQDETE